MVRDYWPMADVCRRVPGCPGKSWGKSAACDPARGTGIRLPVLEPGWAIGEHVRAAGGKGEVDSAPLAVGTSDGSR